MLYFQRVFKTCYISNRQEYIISDLIFIVLSQHFFLQTALATRTPHSAQIAAGLEFEEDDNDIILIEPQQQQQPPSPPKEAAKAPPAPSRKNEH